LKEILYNFLNPKIRDFGGIPTRNNFSYQKGGKRSYLDRRKLSDILMDLVEAHPLYN